MEQYVKVRTKSLWVDDGDTYHCPYCGFESHNPNLLPGGPSTCPKCNKALEIYEYKRTHLSRTMRYIEKVSNSLAGAIKRKAPERDIRALQDKLEYFQHVKTLIEGSEKNG